MKTMPNTYTEVEATEFSYRRDLEMTMYLEHPSPDSLTSGYAAPSVIVLLQFMLLLKFLPFKRSCRNF